MSQDHLQIGLEHHRAGRVRQAEEAYRAVLAAAPDDPEALHWLGVLLTQAGQPAEAIPLLQRAVAGREGDAAYHHNLGQALLMTGRIDDAIAALTESAALEPSRGETFLALARAYAVRRSAGDATAAVAALKRAGEQGIDTPDLHHDLGIALLASGQPDEALLELGRAIAKRPDYQSAAFQTAMAHRAKGDRRAARNWLNKALELNRDYAQAWHALGVIDAEVGNFELAIGHLKRAIRCSPRSQAIYNTLEGILRKVGKPGEADLIRTTADALQLMSALELGIVEDDETDPADSAPMAAPSPAIAELDDRLRMDAGRERIQEALAGISGLVSPARATPAAITHLFDNYAERFDHHLRDKLSYAGPEQLQAAIAKTRRDDRLLDIADLGCGTGLCGGFLRPMARQLVGVDLSTRMLEKAGERGHYDRLEPADLMDFLRRSPDSYDLLLAADVLIYLGDLTPLFEMAWKSLRPGGILAASFEAGEVERYVRHPRTRRFVHSREYLERLGQIFGYSQRLMDQTTLRYEHNNPVTAWIAVFEKPTT
ncbi:tetratricopeptide repeat protein [Humisphaera borealis]|uniref:Tetratricopeptide repeat protein n=1 Tax=Humisphaera borealis TaxID=2807512 RepID=A0A7M2WWY6_9BACT|nr:tetratricopeptide repeat protein [Humisphaera borealis]QOV89854.1 tetratricopeptide repeat protein [Humisphaera borealis]